MLIFLDVSCLNRPCDDQIQPRIRLEAEAVVHILGKCDRRVWRHVSSEIAEIEIAAIRDPERRRQVAALLPQKRDRIRLTEATFQRADRLCTLGVKPADAVHVACAERGRANVLLSCDDRLCRFGDRLRGRIRVPIANPLSWLREVANAPYT
ncbi:MAG: PIN domain-containing protein [Phycisphaerae bacterium]|nr:PIN domain-containing protein [Phycisphaerae bacterium]